MKRIFLKTIVSAIFLTSIVTADSVAITGAGATFPYPISIIRTSDYTAHIDCGEVVEFDATEKVFNDPSSQKTKDYIIHE